MSENSQATILLVEDHQDLAEILELELKKLGHSVHLCNGLDTAHEFLDAEGKVDLILTDFRLSGTTAMSLLSHEKVEQNSVPVLVMTGLDKSYDESILQAGACGILRKPFEFDELERLLLRSLEKNSPRT